MSGLQAVGEAAKRLESSPTDLTSWLAGCLALAGQDQGKAVGTFDELGHTANRYGQVALAVACTCWLRDNGQKQRGAELASAVAKLHARGSVHVDAKLKPSPLAPPPKAAPETDGSAVGVDAFIAASKAAFVAGKKKAPKKLPPTPLVSVLSAAEIVELIEAARVASVAKGTAVITAGEDATSMYWVARGELEVRRGDKVLGQLRSGALFGEIALVGATTRTAEVEASVGCWLIELPAAAIERAAAVAPRLASVLASYARSRLLANVMRTSELFSRLTEDERESLLPSFEPRLYEAEAPVIEKGLPNDRLHVVASGQLEVRDGGAVIATLGIGDGVGEMSLITRKPATANVVAVGRSVILSLARDNFDAAASQHPELIAEVYKLFSEREQENRDALVHDADDLIV